MITLLSISKQFNNNTVVKNINLKISPGEIIGLLGPNGAGKTTTLRMIAGVLPQSEGTIEINGKDIREFAGSIKKKIGFLPENNPLYDEMTVEEYLNFWAGIKGIDEDEIQKAKDFVVEACGITDVYYRPIGELSKGYRQRVGLAQAILTKPDILILDEPTEGLDPNQRHDIAQLIKNLGKKRTVIISSHVLSEIEKIANRMIIIHKGIIVADETPDNMRKIGTHGNFIEIEIKGKNVASALSDIEGVKNVKAEKNNYYLVEVEGKKDIREIIFKTAVSKKWILLTLVQKQQQLEDVFSQLTDN